MVAFTTRILHSDRDDSIEHGSLYKPVHGSVASMNDDSREEGEILPLASLHDITSVVDEGASHF